MAMEALSVRRPYDPDEDEIIINAIEKRASEITQKGAMQAAMHLLPGRTVDGCLYRYHQKLRERDLKAARAKALTLKQEKKKFQFLPQAKSVLPDAAYIAWTTDEDALLWNAVQTRPGGRSIQYELQEALSMFPGRTLSALTNRYYVIKQKLEDELAQATQQEPSSDRPAEPAASPLVIIEPMLPKPMVGTVEATPRLAERAEEFIQSLYSVVEENKALRSQTERLKGLEQIESQLQSERQLTARLRKQIKELEEDRDAFLRLMDKARVIGREENGL